MHYTVFLSIHNCFIILYINYQFIFVQDLTEVKYYSKKLIIYYRPTFVIDVQKFFKYVIASPQHAEKLLLSVLVALIYDSFLLVRSVYKLKDMISNTSF